MSRISDEAIAYSAAALQARDVAEAVLVRNREYGWECGDRSVSIISFILIRTPALLADCATEVLEPLRVAAAMMELWGENNIRRFVTVEGELDYRFEVDAIAHMMHSHGCFLASIEEYRRLGLLDVQLLGAHGRDDCEACKTACGKIFTVDTVPELPLADCTCEDRYGCRVMVIAIEKPR